jgi:hypothetical protein
MTKVTRNQLEKLLVRYPKNQLAKRALEALRSRLSNLHQSTGGLSTTHLVRIYTRRAELNSQKQLGIEGFDELIRLLNRETESSLEIHTVSTDDEAFSIFTDRAISKLVGILVSKGTIIDEERSTVD